MIGKRVICNVKSAYHNRTVQGIIVQQCNNTNVYILKLDHSVSFQNRKTFTYPKGSTILVAASEIM
jgi:hypothetical protein